MQKLALLILILLLVLMAGILVLGPRYHWKARSFFEQLKRTTNPSQVQTWALKQMGQAASERAKVGSAPSFLNLPEDGPPNDICVEPGSGQRYLVIQWGDGFGHWGLLVGDDSLEFPIEDYFCIQWAPGVYVWHERQ